MAFGISYHKSNRASRGIIVATQWRPCGDLVAATAALPLRPAALPLPALCHCCCSATPALLPCHSCPLRPCQPAHSAVCSATAPLISIVAASRRTLVKALQTAVTCISRTRCRDSVRDSVFMESLMVETAVFLESLRSLPTTSTAAAVAATAQLLLRAKIATLLSHYCDIIESLLNYCWLIFDSLLKQTKFFFAPF